MTIPTFHRVAAGDYETADGRYRLYRLQGIYPPAWNVEDVEADVWADGQATVDVIVDGAASKHDALSLVRRLVQVDLTTSDAAGKVPYMKTATTGADMTRTDTLGFTEREWESLWSANSRDDGAQTAHCSKFDNENYCEACDQTVDYSDGSKHGRCGCD